MISDVQPVVWKEWRELLRMSGSGRAALGRHIFSVKRFVRYRMGEE